MSSTSGSSRGPRFSRRIANAAQAASAFDAPVLASLPDLRIRSADRAHGSAAHRRLGENLLELGPARDWRALLFAAPGRRQGKAVAVAAAALGLLQADAQPIVVELDSGGSDVAQLLGGVNVEVRDARGVAQKELPRLIADARATATCVIASGAPLLGEDVSALLDAFDAIVVVARAGVTTPAEARVLRAVLASAGMEIAGVVLTESDDGGIAPRELRARLRAAVGASPDLEQRESVVESREQAAAQRESELDRRERALEAERATFEAGKAAASQTEADLVRRERELADLQARLAAAEAARRAQEAQLAERKAELERREREVDERSVEAEAARRAAAERAEREQRIAEEQAAAQRAREEAEAAERQAEAADWGDPLRGRWRLARLERAMEELRAVDPSRAEEIGFYLEAFAPLVGDDGLLPASVDSVVDEAFGELLPR